MELEDPFTECKQSINIHHEIALTSRQNYPLYNSNPKSFYIDFKFSCKACIHEWDLETHRYNGALLNLPEIFTFARVPLNDFLAQEPARKLIEDKLQSWPVSNEWRKSFIDYAMLKALDETIKMPYWHNNVFLQFRVKAVHKHVYDQRAAAQELMSWTSLENMSDGDDDDTWMEEDDNCYMVPTLDSVIESLENKVVMDDVTTICSICLDELSREGVSIECSHIFHEDCIKNWLRNSHYCPVCRFEMPIAS